MQQARLSYTQKGIDMAQELRSNLNIDEVGKAIFVIRTTVQRYGLTNIVLNPTQFK